VPLAAGWAIKRARELVDPLAARSLAANVAPRAVPPRRLRARTGAPGVREFVDGGRQAASAVAGGLELTGRSIGELRAVLEFGCGSGRVLPHVAALAPEARCRGCDVDASAITWAARHRPELDWLLSAAHPPLPFPAQSFDLVYSISVFSHLDERLQDTWLSELRRVLAPGGAALLSVHGSHAFERFRSGQVRTSWCRDGAFAREPLGRGEFVFEPYLRSFWNRGELPGVGTEYGLAFHGAEYVRERWSSSQGFEVLGVREQALAGWQDLVVCRVR
jgi:SAM-dependent methyltransferase